MPNYRSAFQTTSAIPAMSAIAVTSTITARSAFTAMSAIPVTSAIPATSTIPATSAIPTTSVFQATMVTCFFFLSFPTPSAGQAKVVNDKPPNIIFILTDDMGYGDLSCYNGSYRTPNLDKMAKEGRRFTNYYSASPVCSPSRVGFLTGMHPTKWNITNYLSDKKHNLDCEQNDYLNPSAPTLAKTLKNAGYLTAHFGKWHMGGGRDVKDAPSISNYGFSEWSSTWESPDPDPMLTSSNWIWADTDSVRRWNRTAYFVDKTLDFLRKNKGKPCFINLWPDDVHTPWVPGTDFIKKEGDLEKNFLRVLNEYDVQIGRLLDSLKTMGFDKNTLVVFTSDNGPAPNFRHERSAGMRGTKLSLFEGGIRMPFIVWGRNIPKGTIDSSSVITALDLLPSFASLGGVRRDVSSDGEDLSMVLLGKQTKRKKEIFWEYGRNEVGFDYPKQPGDRSPQLAVRSGPWKLLMNRDGSDVQLYNIADDRFEKNNLAIQEIQIVNTLRKKLVAWRENVTASTR
ncbi:sulfatase family protein [Flavitalea sp.]|nr:sulfatase-like hydrolase/transferase [Flavitalea sp.]